MFVQVIQGHTHDAAGMKQRFEGWHEELKPGAIGYVGSTGGVTAGGDFVLVVRFADEAAAQANGNRPEQGAWWADTEKYFEGDVTFIDSSDVSEWLGGGSDDAGFVQVIVGRTTDRAKLEALEAEQDATMQGVRPEVIGGLTISHDGDRFVQTAYFTSEEAARAGESKPEMQDFVKKFQALTEDVSFYDLTDPWLNSA